MNGNFIRRDIDIQARTPNEYRARHWSHVSTS